MKVYIITHGDYSDYEITRVFIDKEKADAYAKYNNSTVEEWDTSDEDFTASHGYVKITLVYSFIKDADGNYQTVLKTICAPEYTLEKEKPYNCIWSNRYTLSRSFDETKFTVEEATAKTKKVAEDILGMAKYALSTGATLGHLNTILFDENLIGELWDGEEEN